MRYELKSVLPGTRLSQALLWVRLHPAGLRRAYPPRWVNSLYFDTHSLASLAGNLAGLFRRSKLRLRWYGDLEPADHPILELKRKDGTLGRKEQLGLDCSLDLTQPWRDTLTRLRDGLPPVWTVRLRTASQPTLIVRYWRDYYVIADGAVRVTLDSRQVAYEQRLAGRPNLRSPLPSEDLVVLEIKADRASSERIRAVANAFPIPRSRNSKYVKGMLAALYSR